MITTWISNLRFVGAIAFLRRIVQRHSGQWIFTDSVCEFQQPFWEPNFH